MTWVGHDLIRSALTELADDTYQRRVWTSVGPRVGSLTEAISRLYDDSALDHALGGGREVYGSQIDGMLRELGNLLDEIDDRRGPEEILQDPLLLRVRRLAGSILRQLDASADEGTDGPDA